MEVTPPPPPASITIIYPNNKSFLLNVSDNSLSFHITKRSKGNVLYRYRFHEVMALRALMRAVPSLRENGDDMNDDYNGL